MREFISPEIKSYTGEEILEMIGPAHNQQRDSVTAGFIAPLFSHDPTGYNRRDAYLTFMPPL